MNENQKLKEAMQRSLDFPSKERKRLWLQIG